MDPLRIAILGYGNVGSALAGAFLGAGHHVVFGANPDNPNGARRAQAGDLALARAEAASARDAITGADLVVLAVPFGAASTLLPPLADVLTGVTLIDATNPIGPGLTHAGGTRSGAEAIADLLPGAHVVKCFNVYGTENLGGVPPQPGRGQPLMPYAGSNAEAKARVSALLIGLDWDPLDVGPLSAALDLEHLALLWIRLVRQGGRDGHLVWSALPWAP